MCMAHVRTWAVGASVHDEAVAVHGLDAARPLSQLGRARPGDALADHGAVGRDQLDRVPRLEAALAPADADGEEAAAAGDDRFARAVVEHEAPARRLRVLQPELKGVRGR